MIWYTEQAIYAWLKQEKPNLLAYSDWLTGHLQAAFNKGQQVGQGTRANEIEQLQADQKALLDMLTETYLTANRGEVTEVGVPDWIVMAHAKADA